MKAHQIAREHTLEQLSATREDLVDLARRKRAVVTRTLIDWEYARSKQVSATHSWVQIMSPSCQMLVTACAKSSLAFT